MTGVRGSTGQGAEPPVPADAPDGNALDRELRADRREAALDAREARSAAREASQDERELKTKQILGVAVERDLHADQRDQVADRRDASANLEWFVHSHRPTLTDDVKADEARELAAQDRKDSRNDRTASADDRSKLSES